MTDGGFEHALQSSAPAWAHAIPPPPSPLDREGARPTGWQLRMGIPLLPRAPRSCHRS